MNYLLLRAEWEQRGWIESGTISQLAAQLSKPTNDIQEFLEMINGVSDLRTLCPNLSPTPSPVEKEKKKSITERRLLLDFEVPADTYIPKRSTPIIHCSAGCGRTGTLITIDTIETLLKNLTPAQIEHNIGTGNQDVVLEVVDHLREQRICMVQSLEQFAFCYEALLERIREWSSKGVYVNAWEEQVRSSDSLISS